MGRFALTEALERTSIRSMPRKIPGPGIGPVGLDGGGTGKPAQDRADQTGDCDSWSANARPRQWVRIVTPVSSFSAPTEVERALNRGFPHISTAALTCSAGPDSASACLCYRNSTKHGLTRASEHGEDGRARARCEGRNGRRRVVFIVVVFVLVKD
jgi:hypothetical protein